MNITGLTLDEFTRITGTVSWMLYSGNITVHQDGYALYKAYPACVARLTARDSYGPGARTSWTGRHGPYACWHAYRDVLSAVFTAHPDAVIRTMLAVYRGDAGFLRDYPRTAHTNIGSQLSPVTMPELCACDGGGPRVTERTRTRGSRSTPAVAEAQASMSRIDRELADWYQEQGYSAQQAVTRVKRER